MANRIAEAAKVSGQFVIIKRLDELSGTQHLVVLKRLPTLFHRIERGVEQNAVGVQVRVQRSRGGVREYCPNEVRCPPGVVGALTTDSSASEMLQLRKSHLQRPLMR